jgi:hypothetical protein
MLYQIAINNQIGEGTLIIVKGHWILKNKNNKVIHVSNKYSGYLLQRALKDMRYKHKNINGETVLFVIFNSTL